MTLPVGARAHVEIAALSVTYRGEGRPVHAVDSVHLSINKGEALGIVGESGCGKSTLGLAMMRLLPESAEVKMDKLRIGDLETSELSDRDFRQRVRWKRVSMVYQSAMASLNPVIRVGDQLVSAYKLHHPGAGSDEAESKVTSLFEMVGIPASRLRSYPHEYSGGMRQRAVIALSLVADPELVIADEATTALDVVVQAQILEALNELRRDLGLTMIVISHDIGAIATTCDRVAVMYAGQIVETAPLRDLIQTPQHPYTASLMAAIPSMFGTKRRLVALPGVPPDLSDPPSACRFVTRCPIAREVCATVPPEGSGDRLSVRCHFPGEIHSASGGLNA